MKLKSYNKKGKNKFLPLIIAIGVLLLIGAGYVVSSTDLFRPTPKAQRRDLLVGMIRFDIWSPSISFNQVNLLAPNKWASRIPYFAASNGSSLRMDEAPQEIMDRDILYASNAGIDFFILHNYFVMKDDTYTIKTFKASPYKNKMKFILLFSDQAGILTKKENWEKEVIPRTVAILKDPQYLTVEGNRPVIYGLDYPGLKAFFGSETAFAAKQKELTDAIVASGYGKPYYVHMFNQVPFPSILAEIYKYYDAIAPYSAPGLDPNNNSNNLLPYSRLAKENKAYIDRAISLDIKFIPTVNTGFDGRPKANTPGLFHTLMNYEPPTEKELTDNIQKTSDWVLSDNHFDPTNMMFIYAWNEYSEGGFAAPSLASSNQYLAAIAKGLGAPEFKDLRKTAVMQTTYDPDTKDYGIYFSQANLPSTLKVVFYDNTGLSVEKDVITVRNDTFAQKIPQKLVTACVDRNYCTYFIDIFRPNGDFYGMQRYVISPFKQSIGQVGAMGTASAATLAVSAVTAQYIDTAPKIRLVMKSDDLTLGMTCIGYDGQKKTIGRGTILRRDDTSGVFSCRIDGTIDNFNSLKFVEIISGNATSKLIEVKK